jgi:hypothetical protein
MTSDYAKEQVAAVAASIESFAQTMRLEINTPQNGLWHFVLGLLEYCDAKGLDFDSTLYGVREHFNSPYR